MEKERGLMPTIIITAIVSLTVGAAQADGTYPDQNINRNETETVAPGTETETERNKVYMKMGEIVVTEKAGYLTTADAPASVDVIGADQIEMENVDFSMELLKKVPGFYFAEWNQGLLSGAASLRGFDGLDYAPITLIADGIPHNYGKMELQPFFPLEIERMEVVKGTSDPRYGLLNTVGNINLHTKRGGNFTEARLLTGSFETYDASVITGNDNGTFNQTYFVGYRESDGYRDNSDLKKGAASGKWFYTTDDQSLSVGAIARVFGMDANAPGYLTREEAKSNPTKAADFSLFDGGEQENQHVSLHLDYWFSNALLWSFRTYYQHHERTRWVSWSPSRPQQERYNDFDQYGAISTLSYEIYDTFIPRLELNWGLDYQHQDEVDARWFADSRVRQDPFRFYDSSTYYWGSYVLADGDINNWLRLTTALRVDSFDGEMTNQLAGLTTDMVDLGYIWQPKAGFIITPWQGYNLYGNIGRSFQNPSSPAIFGQNSSGSEISRNIAYSKNDGWELGVKASPFTWFSTRIDYWEMVASDEVRSTADGTGNFINAGETKRKGWDFSLSISLHDWVTIWGSYSIIDAEYTDPGPGRQGIKGNDIENTPSYTSKVGVDFAHPTGFFSNLWGEMQGNAEIDPENTKSTDGGYDTWSLSIGYEWEKTTVGFDIKNLFDKSYNSYIWNNEFGYNPADERSFYLWASFKL